MSRTDAHTRYNYLPGGREYLALRERMLAGDLPLWAYVADDTPWEREWSKHWSRSSAEGWYARQENRSERHNAQAALRRGDYDSIPFHMTGRHSAAWLCY
jgi:hypothetical protein